MAAQQLRKLIAEFMHLIDTHCHIDFHKYNADRATVLARARAAGIRQLIIPGVDMESLRRARRLVREHNGLFMAVGIHPNSTADWHGPAHLRTLREFVQETNAVAIGEIGLDYHWDKSPKAVQRRAFEDQLALAAELGLPVIIHNREASADVLPILEDWAASLPEPLHARPGVLHSFSAPAEYAERAIAAGFFLGFTGPVTYKNAEDLRRIAARVPDNRILVETDGPFLTPQPHRGKRNEPAYVALVAERLAALRNVAPEDFAAQTTANARALFALSDSQLRD